MEAFAPVPSILALPFFTPLRSLTFRPPVYMLHHADQQRGAGAVGGARKRKIQRAGVDYGERDGGAGREAKLGGRTWRSQRLGSTTHSAPLACVRPRVVACRRNLRAIRTAA